MIEVNAGMETTKQMAIKIMRILRENLSDWYHLYARGKKNAKAAQQLAKTLVRWIVVDTVYAQRISGESYLMIKFERAVDFRE